jgi:hypothetical protein
MLTMLTTLHTHARAHTRAHTHTHTRTHTRARRAPWLSGAKLIRLDAFGYVTKKAGTECFMQVRCRGCGGRLRRRRAR